MSFLIDPPWLYAQGEAYARAAPLERAEGETPRRLGLGVIALFYVVSISLYLNLRWVHWIARMCGAEDGRDWMLNSGVFRFDHRRAGPRTHAISALIFATYPLWLVLGYRRGLRARGLR